MVIFQAQCSVMFSFEDLYGSSFRAGSVLPDLRGLLRIRTTESLVQGQPLGLAGRQFGADAQLEVLVLAEHSLHSW